MTDRIGVREIPLEVRTQLRSVSYMGWLHRNRDMLRPRLGMFLLYIRSLCHKIFRKGHHGVGIYDESEVVLIATLKRDTSCFFFEILVIRRNERFIKLLLSRAILGSTDNLYTL